jgi:non-ribosomal peptide synthetase component F
MLDLQGWCIVARLERPDWWLHELWVLESRWSPVGARAHVSFLTDPGGDEVWAVSVSRDIENGPCVPLSPHWERDRRAEVFERIRVLRSRG